MRLYIFTIVFSLAAVSLYGQSSGENYIKSTEYLDETANPNAAIINVQYFDGLGRPEQTVSVKATPDGKDIVTKIEYDGFGRQTIDYLPVPVSQSNGGFIDPGNITGNYYMQNYTQSTWYSEKTFENSPLNRVLAQAAPGDAWAKGGGHEIGFEYKTNTANDRVWIYWVDTNGDIQKGNYSTVGNYYEEKTLYKTVTTDENGHKIYEFKDKQGRVVLKRSFVTEYPTSGRPDPNPPTGVNKQADTYYVYDVYGNLAAVIPPLAAEKIGLGTTIIENLCYLYKYDDKNRLVEKKLPGKGKEYMVYDKQDRLVATKDANLEAEGKWLFTKYDKFGRVVYTGMMNSSVSREALQTTVNGFGSNNEERKSTVQFSQNGTSVYYTKNAFPTSFSDVLSVNYYDTYEEQAPDLQQLFEHAPLSDANGQLKGLPVSSFVRVIGTTGWEKAYTAYDDLSRAYGSYKINHLGGFTQTKSELNFKGLPTKTTTAHKSTNNGIQVNVEETFVYDQMLRLLSHHHSINGQTPQLIAKNEYDPLGQLVSKKVGGNQNGSDRWQEVDYKYNIRGWLTDINDVGLVLYGKDADPPSAGDDLFAFKINYNELNDGGSQYAEPLFNGNIAQTIWRTGEDNVKRGYVYNYDELNRLLDAQFYKSDNNPYTGAYTESLAYDLNGNITSLFRTTGDVLGDPVGMDDLAYSYRDGNGNSNLLINVSDAVSNQNTGGFKDGNTNPALDDYEYDANGNLIKDRNKGITSITYNYLNLPEQIVFENSNSIEYVYNAAGVKLKKTVIEETATPEVRKEVDYLDGFQYAGEILNFFPTAEGYVRATPVGNITPGAPPTGYAYSYVYNYTDHLGNVRLSYSMDHLTGKLKILEENHYYPFGLRHEVYVSGTKLDFSRNPGDGIEPEPGLPPVLDYVTRMEYQYKYNGKELQDELGLSWYDYGARNYDATIGRWMNVDPLAEKKPNWTPYRYAFNNPNFFTDPNGMLEDYIDINQETGDITVTKAAGDDQVRLVDNDGNVVKNDYGKEQSYTYGENGSFSKENTISRSGGQTRITSTNPQKAFQFFRFAAKSSVEFGFVRWTSNSNGLQRATVLTNHSKGSIRLNSYMSEILRNNAASRISEYWHSHPAPNPIYSYNNHPSGFTIWGEPDGDELGNGDRQAFDEMQRKFPGRVPSNANIYSDYFNTKTTYNNESFFIHTNYSGGSLMLNSDIGL
ncbi:MAG: DUF6443 domain-containing protein [Weeksellaceae bacterium]